MVMVKCNICHVNNKITASSGVYKCRNCGNMVTAPKISKATKDLYQEAEKLQYSGKYRESADIYQKIQTINSDDPEIYWRLMMCEFCINYDLDYFDNVYKPRVPFGNWWLKIFEEENYQKVLEYADPKQRIVYQAAADNLERFRYWYSNEPIGPFDIFICCHRVDEHNTFTRDNNDAFEIYHYLVSKGYKVYFARDDYRAYEQYASSVMAALKNAKIMLLICSDKNQLNKYYVYREWNYFLKLKQQDPDKTIIPVYKNLEISSLPNELKNLTSIDSNQANFQALLLDAIKQANPALMENKYFPIIIEPSAHTGYWGTAENELDEKVEWALNKIEKDYSRRVSIKIMLDRILAQYPEHAKAHLALFLWKFELYKVEHIKFLPAKFRIAGDPDFQAALNYGDEKFKKLLNDILRERRELFKEKRRQLAKQARYLKEQAPLNKEKKSGRFGTYTDPRDGQVYKTIKIGKQTWLAENLRYTGVPHLRKRSRYGKNYNYLYTWENALQAAPPGWHLPSYEEFKNLMLVTDGRDNLHCLQDPAVKDREGNGNNASGFSAIHSGGLRGKNYVFWEISFWSADLQFFDTAYVLDLNIGTTNQSEYLDSCLAVRCIKDGSN